MHVKADFLTFLIIYCKNVSTDIFIQNRLLVVGNSIKFNSKSTNLFCCSHLEPCTAYYMSGFVLYFNKACDLESEEVGQESTGEEKEPEQEMQDENQREQAEQCETGETERRDVQGTEIEEQTKEDRVESEREKIGEMEGQKEGLKELDRMAPDEERALTE